MSIKFSALFSCKIFYIVLLDIFLLLPATLIAQSDHIVSPHTLPSNSAVAVAKFVAFPVGQFTGLPNIDIPLCSIEGHEINWSLGLRYHSAYIEDSIDYSYVGRGWSLDGLGMITRVINGISDFNNGGYIGAASPPPSFDELSASFITNAMNKNQDTGPDLFYYNFGGNAGKFMFSENGELINDPMSHLKIEPLNDDLSEWTVLDDAGYQYIFGGAGALERTAVNSANKGAVTTWYLKKIISPLKESLEFSYTAPDLIKNNDYQRDSLTGIYTNSFNNDTISQYRLEMPKFYSIPYLSTITYERGAYGRKIDFKYQTVEESSERILNKINIYYKKHESWKLTKYCKLYYAEDMSLNLVERYNSSVTDPVSAIGVTYKYSAKKQKLVAKLKYSSGKQVSYFYQPHDLSNYDLSGELLEKLKLGVRIRKVSITGQEASEIDYTYLDEDNESSARLTIPVPDFKYNAARWVKFIENSYTKVSGDVNLDHAVPLFKRLLGGPLVTYSHVTTSSAKKGKVLNVYRNDPYTVGSEIEGYYKKLFLQPFVGLDFRNGKLIEQKTYKKLGDEWYPMKHIFWRYQAIPRSNLNGLNLIMVDAAGDRNIQNAASYINANTNYSISYKDIVGAQFYSIPVSWDRLVEKETIISEESGIFRTTITDYNYNNQNFLKNQVTQLSDNSLLEQSYTYPFDYAGQPVYDEMCSRSMLSYIVESRIDLSKPQTASPKILEGSVNEYGFFPDNNDGNDRADNLNENILTKSNYVWEVPGEGESPVSDIPTLTDKNYKLFKQLSYDQDGFIDQVNSKGQTVSLIRDKSTNKLTAQAINAGRDEIYFNGFEDGSANESKSGNSSHEGGQFTIPFDPPGASSDYMLSYWYLQYDKWNYKEMPYTSEIDEGDAIDEVRVYPKDAILTSQALDAEGKIISRTDPNNLSMYYDYNDKDEIEDIRDNNKDIVKTIENTYSRLLPCDPENVGKIFASFHDGDNTTMIFDQVQTIEVDATGGCGPLYYKWYLIDENNTETLLGYTYDNKIELKPICSEYFIIKCEVHDAGNGEIKTIRKYVNVDTEASQVTINITSSSGDFSFCEIGSDQMVMSAQAAGGCGSYSYHWTYTYHNASSNGNVTVTESGKTVAFAFMGSGTITCHAEDTFGNEASVGHGIGQDVQCR